MRYLHREGHHIILHYRSSDKAAKALADELNTQRPDSVVLYQADLNDITELYALVMFAKQTWGGVDILINNASAFYATDVMTATPAEWDDLLGSNLKAPFFLIQALAATLKDRKGGVINLVDIHAEKGLEGFPIYSIAKAGLVALTRILAKELAPEVRVNAIAPGAILWPEEGSVDCSQMQEIQKKVALQRMGQPDDIAKAIHFLIKDAYYMTGQILTIDGGRTLFS